ncbi:MAG: ATP synthase subunit I [Acidobacteriota bacterium]|nr:ATP synthase subunit I [Acidobacteriota bacterium]
MSLKDSNEHSEDENRAVERRLERNTYVFTLLATVAGLHWSGWRMALGVLIGSALSLFNKRWLRGSLQVMLDRAAAEGTGQVPSFTAFKFVLRYVVIALVIGAAVWLGRVHPLGIGVGFAAIVGGAMIETVYQLYMGFKTNPNSSQE